MKKKSFLIALPMLVALGLTGCTATDVAPEVVQSAEVPSVAPSTPAVPTPAEVEVPAPAPASEAPTPVASGTALEALNKLIVSAEVDAASYDRDLFNHWVSDNSTGCDTRIAVLVEESLTKPVKQGCKVLSGEWHSVYDGKTVTDPKTLDIDHMVPLAEAWRSGASKWSAAEREAFANDLDFADSLVAVTAASNRSKSDDDPANYLPTDSSYTCTYVAKWIAVKTRWNLTVDTTEKNAINGVLAKCGDVGAVDSGNANVKAPSAVEAPKEEPVAPAPAPAAPAPVAPAAGGTDPQFASCKAALAAGYGPYVTGDPEFGWYRDGDGDGTVCEK